MKILSLFDGMACGMLAMLESGVEVETYDAYEIDKYAIAAATHNFPDIRQHGDVFKADFTAYKGVDFLIGGSPCTYWSIAQTKNRETVASGMGWELFSQYVRALHEAEPQFFIYENNKSMSKDIRRSIDEAFGFKAVLINSALVSAQNRQRLYWVGRRNADGTYSKVDVEQPTDRGILLKDVLDSAVAMREKSHAVIGSIGRNELNELHPRPDGKTNTLTTVGKDNRIAEPINVTADGKSQTLKAQYVKNNADNFCCYSFTYGASGVAEPIGVSQEEKAHVLTTTYWNAVPHDTIEKHRRSLVAEPLQVGAMPRPNGELSTSQAFRVYDTQAKSVTISAGGGGAGGKTGLYAIPYTLEYDADGKPIKALTQDGRSVTVYEVKDGKITIKGKQYPIKLADGFYIIRKLTVSECKRLQTVPEWYDFSVISNSQAYKCLGNGWTIAIISHLINACLREENR